MSDELTIIKITNGIVYFESSMFLVIVEHNYYDYSYTLIHKGKLGSYPQDFHFHTLKQTKT